LGDLIVKLLTSSGGGLPLGELEILVRSVLEAHNKDLPGKEGILKAAEKCPGVSVLRYYANSRVASDAHGVEPVVKYFIHFT
jgi:hypothetical protein